MSRMKFESLDREKYIDGLLMLKQVFDKHGIHFWLERKTLLGAVHDGKMIPRDEDVDVSTWVEDLPKS